MHDDAILLLTAGGLEPAISPSHLTCGAGHYGFQLPLVSGNRETDEASEGQHVYIAAQHL